MNSHDLGRADSIIFKEVTNTKQDVLWFKKESACLGAFNRRLKSLSNDWLQMNTKNGEVIYVHRELLHKAETIERLFQDCYRPNGLENAQFKSVELTTFDVPFSSASLVTFLEFLVAKRELNLFTPDGTLRLQECSEMFKIASYFGMTWCFKEVSKQFSQYLQDQDAERISELLEIDRSAATQSFPVKMLNQIYSEGLFDAQHDPSVAAKLARLYPGHKFRSNNENDSLSDASESLEK